MPRMQQIATDLVEITITEQEVLAIREEEKNCPTIGQIVQDLLTHTLGLELKDEYWESQITGAKEAFWDDEKRFWKYVYRNKDGQDLILG